MRTAFDLARRPDRTEGAVAIDALTHAGLVDLDALRAFVAEHAAWRGVRLAARALDLANPLAESPMETRMRLHVVFAGLPAPAVQLKIYDGQGRFVARVDLGYEELRLALEFDGRHHLEHDQWVADLARQNELLALGWTIRRYTGRDVHRRPWLVERHVREAFARAAA